MRVSLDLVPCEPYGGKLTATACAERWRKARTRGHPLHESSCRTCKAGKVRAKARGSLVPLDGNPEAFAPMGGHRYERVPGYESRKRGRGREVYAKCSCERTPARWVWAHSVRAGYACPTCGQEKAKRAAKREGLARGTYSLGELVDLDQARRHESTRRNGAAESSSAKPPVTSVSRSDSGVAGGEALRKVGGE